MAPAGRRAGDDDHGVHVQRTGVAEGPVQRDRAVLVDHGGHGQGVERRFDVVDHRGRRTAVLSEVVVVQRDADVVGVLGGLVSG